MGAILSSPIPYRFQLFEVHDLASCPAFIRDFTTEVLAFIWYAAMLIDFNYIP